MAHGRLADPETTLGTDPRVGPREWSRPSRNSVSTATLPLAPLTIESPLEEKRAFTAMNEEVVGAVLAAFGEAVPAVEGVTTTTTTITGADSNDITLYISRPQADGALPGLVHLHGGGMAIGSAADVAYTKVREYVAATGLVVIGVEFRNSGGQIGAAPLSGRPQRLRSRCPVEVRQPRRSRHQRI